MRNSTVAKPRTVVCHICGREFGSASIDIHVPKCAKKWEEVEAQKPENERRPVPQKPSVEPGLSLEEYNKAAQKNFEQQGMMRCPNCGRTFLEDRLQVHLKSCKPKGGEQGAKSGVARSPTPVGEGMSSADAGEKLLKPRTVVCHICGREFGTASIDIHVPKCAKKWKEVEAQKPENERRPVPQKPSVDPDTSREEYNKAAQENFNEQGMMRCPNCGRTFLEDRLEVHLRSCKPKGAGRGAKTGAEVSPTPAGEARSSGDAREKVIKPRTVVCHICGREFGTASIDIHIPQCAKKWEEVEAQKPDHKRRPVPQKPSVDPDMSHEEYNKAAQENFNEQGMMRCPNCGRTFLEDRLEVHLRSCKPKGGEQGTKGGVARSPTPVGRVSSSGDSDSKMFKPRTVVCHICGREFGTASIDIHIPQCAKKWKEVEAQKPDHKRRPVPQKPSVDPDMSHEEYNKTAQETFNEQGMMRCPTCGLTFLEDRLEVHLRSCKQKGRARSSGDPALKTQKAEHEQRAVPQKPVMESARNLEEQDKAMGSACKAGSLPPSRPPRSPAIVPQASLPPSARASAPGRHAFSTELSAARRRSSSSSPARRLANARALDGELAAKRHAIATQIAAAEASHAQHLVQMLPDRSPSSSSSSS